MKPVHIAEKLLHIVRQYPIQNGEQKITEDTDIIINNNEPEIIISESFH